MARARTNGFDFVYERVETRSPRSRFLAVGSSLAPGQKPVGVRAWSAGRDGTGWDGTGWDGIGWDGIGWDGTQRGGDSNGTGLKRDRTQTGRDSNGTGLKRDGTQTGRARGWPCHAPIRIPAGILGSQADLGFRIWPI